MPLSPSVSASASQTQLLEEKRRELLDCHDQLEVAREAEEEYERRLDEEEAKGRRRVHALEVNKQERPWRRAPTLSLRARFNLRVVSFPR